MEVPREYVKRDAFQSCHIVAFSGENRGSAKVEFVSASEVGRRGPLIHPNEQPRDETEHVEATTTTHASTLRPIPEKKKKLDIPPMRDSVGPVATPASKESVASLATTIPVDLESAESASSSGSVVPIWWFSLLIFGALRAGLA